MSSVFISYSFSDVFAGKIAEAVKNLLSENYIFLDYNHGNWEQNSSILETIKKCDYFICVFKSGNPNVMLELGYAMGKNKKIILIAEHDDIPYDLRSFEYIKRSENINEIVMELNKRICLSNPIPKEMICYCDYKENIMRAKEDKEFLDNMDYREFEIVIYEYLMAQNLEIVIQKMTKDKGYDFYIPKLNRVVDVKKYNRSSKVSLSVIRTFLGVMVENNVNKGIIISSTEFTRSALNFVENLEQQIVLLSLQDLLKLDGDFMSVFK